MMEVEVLLASMKCEICASVIALTTLRAGLLILALNMLKGLWHLCLGHHTIGTPHSGVQPGAPKCIR